MNYDAIVIGGGIAGMESAINLGDMGYKVLLVEKTESIGGKMILLSKVFPTLDCASCIATPKMAETAHHPNVDLLVYSEVKEVKKNPDGTFTVKIFKKPTYVNNDACTGCQQCEFACTVAIQDRFNIDMVSSRAAHIAFPQAIPKKAIIERAGSSPCSFACPAGIKAHGYVSLVRSGKFEEAFKLILEDNPLVGSLGRACFAPCEEECTRGLLEGPIPIRQIKRFVADYYYEKHPEPEIDKPEKNGKKVAIVGSGPSGLTAAYHLAKKGYDVTIFEADSEPGGLMKTVIPEFRLPKEVVDRDIENVTALGVEIKTNTPIKSVKELKEKGFDAVFIATGASVRRFLNVEGENLEGVYHCIDFLKRAKLGDNLNVNGKRVLVVGGGNAAIDPARVALRLGAEKVILQYRRRRKEMPAYFIEVEQAEEEGVEFKFLCVPIKFIGENGRLKRVVCQKMELGEPDESGRRVPIPIPGSEFEMEFDIAIIAIGNYPSTSYFADELELNSNGTIKVDPMTLQTSLPYVFAGGDAVLGPSTITEACGLGKRAAFYIDRFLRGEELNVEFDKRLPVVSKEEVLKRQKVYTTRTPVKRKERQISERIHDFKEVELPLTKEEVRYSASRCLDCGICSECHQCIKSCPANAIDFSQTGEEIELTVKTVITSTGFELFPAELKLQYGFGRFKNVITAMQMDRLLSPTRPYNTVLRPSDGKIPDNIAFILCTGSRDYTADNPLCSRVCCMYSLKQAQLLMGALPLADITIYYIDIRAFGKGFEEFYQQAKGMGVYFTKGKVAKIEELENGNLLLYVEDIESGEIKKIEHDLVVLSVGLLPNVKANEIFQGKLEFDEFFYIREVDEDLNPGKTSVDGIYVTGCASGPMDIPDTILHSGAAVAQAAAYIEKIKGGTK